MPDPHHVLWTSGWDSTYRVCDLVLRLGRPVQPHYIADPRRSSTRVELATLERLRQAVLAKDAEARERLAPLSVYRLVDLREDPALMQSLGRLRRRGALGEQYAWLASFARQYGHERLELSVHRDDKARTFVRDHVEAVHDDPSQGWVLSRPLADPDLVIFERFSLPVLDMTKTEMAAQAQAHGFLDVLDQTWFCHVPTWNGSPCGRCTPCVTTVQEGLSRRVPVLGNAVAFKLRRRAYEMTGRARLALARRRTSRSG